MTLLPYAFVKGLWDSYNNTAKVNEKDPQTWSEVMKLVEKFNRAQQVTTALSLPMVKMMSYDDRCFVCGKIGHIGHHCPNALCYNSVALVISPRTAQRKLPHQDHLITVTYYTPSNVTITTTGTDHNLSIINAARENASTGQGHTTNPNTAEAPACSLYHHCSSSWYQFTKGCSRQHSH